MPKPNQVVCNDLFRIDYELKIPRKEGNEWRVHSIIVRAPNKEEAVKIFNEYSQNEDWIRNPQNPEPVNAIISSELTNEPKGISKLTFIQYIEEYARKYIPDAWESIIRNKHMNDITKSDRRVDQKVIEALFVDFINYAASQIGVDYGMYTKDLKKEK